MIGGRVRWSDYLATLPDAASEALVNDLTAGYGALAFMARQLARNGELRAVTRVLERAEAALDRAYRQLAPGPAREVPPPAQEPPPGQRWHGYLAGRAEDGGAELLVRLQDAVAEAQAAGEVIGADGTVEEIGISLRSALDRLRDVRWALAEAP